METTQIITLEEFIKNGNIYPMVQVYNKEILKYKYIKFIENEEGYRRFIYEPIKKTQKSKSINRI